MPPGVWGIAHMGPEGILKICRLFVLHRIAHTGPEGMLSARWEIGPVNLIHINILWDMVKRLQPERPRNAPSAGNFGKKEGNRTGAPYAQKHFPPFLSILSPT